MERNFTWHDILKRMKDDACPICTLVRDRSESKLDVLQYQHVSDVEFRKNFLDTKGFCQHHTERFYAHGDALNHAIVYAHLLEVELNRHKKNKKSKEKATCMLCEGENKSETIYLNIFKKAYHEDDFRQAYEKDGIVCMQHFKTLLKNMKRHPYVKHFESSTLQKLEARLHELKEIKRKNDHKAASERLTTKEKTTWQSIRKLLIDQGEHRR